MPKIVIDPADLYTLDEAASLLSIGIATLFRWLKKGKVIPLRVSGRTLIPKSEIERIKRGEANASNR